MKLFFFFFVCLVLPLLDSKRLSISKIPPNVICRSFSLSSVKQFSKLGSFENHRLLPASTLPEIAFVGRSNVGKSSLLNCLTGKNKNVALQSKTPGCTQSIDLYKCSDISGDICTFVDLPGYGYAKLSKENQMTIGNFLKGYLSYRPCLRFVVVLIDIRRERQDSDMEIINFLKSEYLPFILVATKSDKVKSSDMKRSLLTLSQEYEICPKLPLSFSSFSGAGKKELWHCIKGGILGQGEHLSWFQPDDGEEESEIEENKTFNSLDMEN